MKFIYRDNYIKMGLKISYYRKLTGMTQQQLAAKLDKDTSFISQIEAPNVARAITIDSLFDIATALGVPAHKLIDFDDD